MQETNISINEIIMYLRKSRSDDPYMTVEEVLARHERQLQEYALSSFGSIIPEERIFREVVSGETIADRPVRVVRSKVYWSLNHNVSPVVIWRTADALSMHFGTQILWSLLHRKLMTSLTSTTESFLKWN